MTKDDNEKHFFGQVTQKAFIEHEGKVLLVQYPEGNPAADLYDMPGGRLNEGELPAKGLKREVQEEISSQIVVEGILAVGTFTNMSGNRNYFVIYKASLADSAQTLVAEDGEIGKIEWRDKREFLDLPVIYSEYKEALRAFLV